MTGQHTPGPWAWMLMGETTRNPLHVLESPDKDVVLTVKDAEFGPTTNPEANRRLIATAPELLEAAKALIDCYANQRVEIHESCWATLEAAIAKAEGRTP